MKGFRIKNRRKELGFTREDIADELNTTVTTVYRWETEKTDPNDKTKLALAKLLKTSVGYLMGETDNPDPKSDFSFDISEIIKNIPSPEQLYKEGYMNSSTSFNDMEYWSDVVEKASNVAFRRDKQEIAGVTKMLNLALSNLMTLTSLLDIANKNKIMPVIKEITENTGKDKNTPTVSAYNGNNSVYAGNNLNTGVMS